MCVIFVWGCELIIWLLAILPRGLSVQGVFESPQHEITTKYEFQISQSTKGKFDQSNGLAFSASVEILRASNKKDPYWKRFMCKMNLQHIFQENKEPICTNMSDFLFIFFLKIIIASVIEEQME